MKCFNFNLKNGLDLINVEVGRQLPITANARPKKAQYRDLIDNNPNQLKLNKYREK